LVVPGNPGRREPVPSFSDARTGQLHARKNHSFLWVFDKPAGGKRRHA
jgi:hypothetical protein